MPRMRHAHFDHDMARRREMTNLPTVNGHVIGQLIAAQSHLPKRRRGDVLHKTAGGDMVAFRFGDARHFVDFLLPNRAGMHIGLVGQVHQVIDHQAVVARDVIKPTAISPSRVIEKLKLRNQVFTGLVSLPRPDPDKAIALDHRETANRRKAPHTLTGHGDGFAFAPHFEPVVATDQVAVFDKPQRKWCATVRTKIFQSDRMPLGATVKHHALATNLATQGLILEVVRHARYVPSIF